MESDSSAKAGSKASSGASDVPFVLFLAESRKDDRDEGRRGVVGREIGPRLPDVERFMLLPACGVVEEDMAVWLCCQLPFVDLIISSRREACRMPEHPSLHNEPQSIQPRDSLSRADPRAAVLFYAENVHKSIIPMMAARCDGMLGDIDAQISITFVDNPHWLFLPCSYSYLAVLFITIQNHRFLLHTSTSPLLSKVQLRESHPSPTLSLHPLLQS